MSGPSFKFSVYGRPVTWRRTNHVQVGGKTRRTTGKAQRAAKEAMAWRALAARPAGWPLDALYRVEVTGVWPTRVYGDVDRLVSLPMDALEGVAYRTDRQVASIRGTRLVGDQPMTVVTVTVIDSEAT